MPKPAEIDVSNQTDVRAEPARISCAVAATVAAEGGTVGSISVSLVDEASIALLNQRGRGKDGSTDVLSYPFDDSFPSGAGGELLICPAVAQRGAEAAGHDLANELDLLAVHGTLHLLGYADATEAEAAEMDRRTQPILAALRRQTEPSRG